MFLMVTGLKSAEADGAAEELAPGSALEPQAVRLRARMAAEAYPATTLAEQDAARAFGGPGRRMLRLKSSDADGRTFVEVLALRERGRLSDGTYERAMLARAPSPSGLSQTHKRRSRT